MSDTFLDSAQAGESAINTIAKLSSGSDFDSNGDRIDRRCKMTAQQTIRLHRAIRRHAERKGPLTFDLKEDAEKMAAKLEEKRRNKQARLLLR